jgi:UDP-N-acetylmuramoyl-L-alanyl-D-glutamate--2,6-diaminopimelate ligase
LVVEGGTAVINVDHQHAEAVIGAAKARGLKLFMAGQAGNPIRLIDVAIEGFAQKIAIAYAGRPYVLKLPLVGAFQVENALVAAGLAISTGSDPDKVFGALEHLTGAKGRLEFAGDRNGAPIFVDYAHKPDALAKALEALRPYARGSLAVVFGCGGDRDRGKRPMMGAVAADLADRIVLTDDNPRSEDPAGIVADIRAGLHDHPHVSVIHDRRAAIATAVERARPGDIVLVAGKGHETGQEVAGEVHPFDDRDVVREELAR